jgi:hypothetical protein
MNKEFGKWLKEVMMNNQEMRMLLALAGLLFIAFLGTMYIRYVERHSSQGSEENSLV